MFNPSIGVLAAALRWLGVDWNYLLNAPQAILLVILAAAWKQVFGGDEKIVGQKITLDGKPLPATVDPLPFHPHAYYRG